MLPLEIVFIQKASDNIQFHVCLLQRVTDHQFRNGTSQGMRTLVRTKNMNPCSCIRSVRLPCILNCEFGFTILSCNTADLAVRFMESHSYFPKLEELAPHGKLSRVPVHNNFHSSTLSKAEIGNCKSAQRNFGYDCENSL